MNRLATALAIALIAGSAFGQDTASTAATTQSRSAVDNSGRSPNIPRESDIRPVPDPTVLTTQQLLREIDSTKEVIRTRLDAMDKAILLLQAQASRSPTNETLETSSKALDRLVDEKFKRVETQILERDAKVEQTAMNVKAAVDAALQAAKEAVSEQNKSNALAMSKSEAGFTKQIDQQQQLVQQTTKSTDDRFEDLKLRHNALEARLGAMEGRSKGIGDSWGFLIGAAALGAFVVMVITLVLGRTKATT